MSKVNLTKESVEGVVQQGATSISQVYKMLGGTGNVSGSTIDEYYSHLDHDFKMGEMNKLDIGVRKVS